jgi:hypothetical protein
MTTWSTIEILSLTSRCIIMFIRNNTYYHPLWEELSREQEELKNNWLPVPDIYDKIIFQFLCAKIHTSFLMTFLLYFILFFFFRFRLFLSLVLVFLFNCEQRKVSKDFQQKKKKRENEKRKTKKNVNNWLQCGFHTQPIMKH